MRTKFVVALAVSAIGVIGTAIDPMSPIARAHAMTETQAAVQAAPVDFVRDVQPILRQSCYGCHGPSQQMNGFRLDRRRDAMRGGVEVAIGPGNADASKLYLRLVGTSVGPQMPPTGPLPAHEAAIIKAWIDQGAQWPDAASGEQAATIEHPAARGLIAQLRDGDYKTFRSRISRDGALVNARGPGGSSMLMFAALYGDLETVRALLERRADVNVRNDVGATALLWSAPDVEKTRALLDRGADVDARSDDGRTALMIAAGTAGATPAVKLLIDRGANVNATGPSLFGPSTPLIFAALSGNREAFRLLVAAGADLKQAGPAALALSLRSECSECADMVIKALPPPLITATMMLMGPPTGPALATPLFLAHGATLDARDDKGRSMLMLAAASEAMPTEVIKDLLGRKMDVNAKAANGDTAIGLARRHGNSTVVQMLLAAGATDEPVPPAPSPSPAGSAREALERSLPLLQKSDVTFLKKSGCVSCHNNTLTAMTVTAARKQGMRVDNAIASDQAKKIAAFLESWRERGAQGMGIPGDADTVSYILLGLAAQSHPGDLATDAQAEFLRRQQSADGRWRIFANRPPIESSDIEVTAASMRALQMYAPKARRAEYDKSIAAAAAWLRTATPRVTEDRAFHLFGLHWSNAAKPLIQQAGRALIAEQRPDGGWSQLPSMQSDAYATGQSLVALVQSGVITTGDPVYRRGVEFLLKTQLADGSWFVRSRAIGFQPIFNADFPHGPDAFISAAASNWASYALALSPDVKSSATGARD